MTGAPKVSVVMPAYNAAASIGAAIRSVLDQDLEDLELVVVDDGSTDGTAALLAALSDPRVKVVRHGSNLGPVEAGRTAVQHASAPLIARLDADDVALAQRLRRQYEILRDRPAVGLVASAFVAFDADGAETAHGVPPDHAAAWFRLHFENCVAHSTAMFRRSAYDAAGGYDARYLHAEDHQLWLRMAEVADVATIADPLARYRSSAGSVTARFGDTMARSSIAACADACERTTGRRPPDAVLARLRCGVAPADDAGRAELLGTVVGVYVAVWHACRARDLPTGSLPGQLAAVLASAGLLADPGGRRALARYAWRHPRHAALVGADRLSARRRRRRSG